ncbi:uncharacterized protein EKO05_0001111 [Ascochyta rabiei]|uniref:Uncharacterized protein n=1 Tax=Didymella rabiei TaxID=5454 RepID=A0A162YSW0_DIDRA|nr:uncharacterized protein EKO05_0001111 [Ascochyta rabiei]KZM20208.1 hypothetical protein ST47_g8659 [Ascochyta rabiei]UPX10451.1 hypothetical protein EKO05_0001111 [Ascochyta rabiei]
MNYASWIEEKNLKKTFICATLASTLVGTFTASMGLWERVHDRREAHKQKQTDSKQDGEIKQLREQFEAAQKKGQERQEEIDRLRSGGGGRGGGGGGGGGGRGGGYRDDVGESFEKNGMMIQRMYDDMYGKMGNRFARGDAITENQLQAQIIALQQTVITVLQDALYNDRQLTRSDMAKLVAASNSAREGSLRALQDQQQRLSSHSSNRSPSPQRSIAAPPKRSSTSLVDASDQLFCRYSLDLQYVPNKPLAASMAPGGSCECPACGIRLDVTGEDFWMIGKRTPLTIIEKGYETDIMETREFCLGQRFAVKCHTPDGEYACVICSKNRDVDAICRNVESLVKHVGTYHEVEELEREVDLRETVVVDKRRLSLPAPPREGSLLIRERDVVDMRGYR